MSLELVFAAGRGPSSERPTDDGEAVLDVARAWAEAERLVGDVETVRELERAGVSVDIAPDRVRVEAPYTLGDLTPAFADLLAAGRQVLAARFGWDLEDGPRSLREADDFAPALAAHLAAVQQRSELDR